MSPGRIALWVGLGLVVLALVALALTKLLALWRRWRTRPAELAIPRHPLVLVHGLGGFDALGVGKLKVSYFRRIARDLAGRGALVHVSRQPAYGALPARAEKLAAFVRALPEGKVNLIAHSMGGLDARYALTRLGLADRVAALVTIATPHHGTPLADLAALRATTRWRRWLARLGLGFDALDWLTVKRAPELNRELVDVPGVFYASVVARAGAGTWWRVPTLFPLHWFLKWRGAGDNDGLVPVDSQRWGEVLAEVALDHATQIGWGWGEAARKDSMALYERICQELRRRGY
jgi:triacylglycerol lipase